MASTPRASHGNSLSPSTVIGRSVLLLLALTAGWLLFAILFHEDTLANDMDGITGAMPGKPTVRRARGGRVFNSPAPAVRPAGKSAYTR